MFKKLDAFLFSKNIALTVYCFKAFLAAFIPSICFLSLAYYACAKLGIDIQSVSPPARVLDWPLAFGTLILAPFIETVLLSLNLKLFGFFLKNPYLKAWTSGLFWGLLHGTQGLLWFFGTFWSFFIMSCAYLNWIELSYKHGFVAAALPHFLINCAVILTIYIDN